MRRWLERRQHPMYHATFDRRGFRVAQPIAPEPLLDVFTALALAALAAAYAWLWRRG